MPGPVSAVIGKAGQQEPSAQQTGEVVARLTGTHCAYQAGKIRVVLPEGMTYGEYLEEMIDKYGRLLADCDILATYAKIFFEQLGVEPENVVILCGYNNASDYGQLTGNEAHALLAVTFDDRCILFDPTHFAPLPDADIIVGAIIEDIENNIGNLGEVLAELKADAQKHADRIAEIKEEIELLNEKKRKFDEMRGRKRILLATEHDADYFRVSPEMAEQLDMGAAAEPDTPTSPLELLLILSGGVPVEDPQELQRIVRHLEELDVEVSGMELSSQKLTDLLTRLASGDPDERYKTIEELGRRGSDARKTLPALISLLDDDRPVRIGRDYVKIRDAAGKAIIKIGGMPEITEDNIGLLIKLRENVFGEYPYSRSEEEKQRLQQFVELGEPAIRGLIHSLQHDPVQMTRWYARDLLAEFRGDPSVVQRLVRLSGSIESHLGVGGDYYYGALRDVIRKIRDLSTRDGTTGTNYLLQSVPGPTEENVETLISYLILGDQSARYETRSFREDAAATLSEVRRRLDSLDQGLVTGTMMRMAVDPDLLSELRSRIVEKLLPAQDTDEFKRDTRRIEIRDTLQRQIMDMNVGPLELRFMDGNLRASCRVLSDVSTLEDTGFMLPLSRANNNANAYGFRWAVGDTLIAVLSRTVQDDTLEEWFSSLKITEEREKIEALLNLSYWCRATYESEDSKGNRKYTGIRPKVIKTFLEIGRDKVITCLLENLTMKDDLFDARLATVLADLKAEEAVGHIGDVFVKNRRGYFLHSDMFIDALRRIGSPAAIGILQRELDETLCYINEGDPGDGYDFRSHVYRDNKKAVGYYVHALGKVGSKDAIEVLENAASLMPGQTENVITALQEIGGEEAEAAVKRIEASLQKTEPDRKKAKATPGSPAVFSDLTDSWQTIENLTDLASSTVQRDLMILSQADVAEREGKGLSAKFRRSQALREKDEYRLDQTENYLNFLFSETRGNVVRYTRGDGRSTLVSALRENFAEDKKAMQEGLTSLYGGEEGDMESAKDIVDQMPENTEYAITVNTDREDAQTIAHFESQAKIIEQGSKGKIKIAISKEALGEEEPTYSFNCTIDGKSIGETSIDLHAHEDAIDRTTAMLNIGLAASAIPQTLQTKEEYAAYQGLIDIVNRQYKSLDLVGDTLIRDQMTPSRRRNILHTNPITIVLPPVERVDYKQDIEQDMQRDLLMQKFA